MVRDIEEGRQLSDAMKRHPRLFNNVFVSMIRAGETGGFLKEIIDRIVEMQEKRQGELGGEKDDLPGFDRSAKTADNTTPLS
ncbi:hypothetical protein ES703_116855 [subsurface metagenome]